MITLPDFKEKQILFIKTENGFSNKIRIYNENIVFEKEDKIENRVSCYKVFCVFIIGNISITSELIRQGLKYGISFFLLRNNFECYARISSKNEGNYLLRMSQYTIDSKKELLISRNLVFNKIRNQFNLLKSKNLDIDKIIDIKNVKMELKNINNLDNLRGIEGKISKIFFENYFKDIGWIKRMPRVKSDEINYLLDMGYTFLFNFIDSLLNLFGFDTYKGFYHKLFFQRKSLTCDLIEPFRCIIDRSVLKIFNLKVINKNDFKFKDGKIFINYKNSDKYVLFFLKEIMKYKEEIYLYIRNFYLYILNHKKYKFPFFKIR